MPTWRAGSRTGISLSAISAHPRLPNSSKNFSSTDGQTHHDWELYEIDTDPLEQNDIASDNYPLVEELAREWHQWASRTDGIVGYERWMFKLQHYWQTGSRTYLNDAF